MTSDPKLPSSDEADPESMTTPAGQIGDLQALAEDTDATVEPEQES